MTSTTITVNGLAAMSYALGEASASVDNLRKSAEVGDVSPEQAAERLANILALLLNGLGEEHEEPVKSEYRYFREGSDIWKMPKIGRGFTRNKDVSDWSASICDLSEMIDSGTKEISAQEGEPK